MRALTYAAPSAKTGRPELRIVDLPVPSVGDGEVLVRVHFAALSHFEFWTWRGERNRAIARAVKKRAVVSGIEMAGVVETDGARVKKGDRVVGYTHIVKGPFFHTENAWVPEHNLALTSIAALAVPAAALGLVFLFFGLIWTAVAQLAVAAGIWRTASGTWALTHT